MKWVAVFVALIIIGVCAFIVIGEEYNKGSKKEFYKPDYYENPYYTLSYTVSNESKTLTTGRGGKEIITYPTGKYTFMLDPNTQYFGGLPTLEQNVNSGVVEDTGYVWWDIVIEIYAKPDTDYGITVYCTTSIPHKDRDGNYILLPGIYNNFNFNHYLGDWIHTDSNGRYTLTFSLGALSHDVMTDARIDVFGSPRSITKL